MPTKPNFYEYLMKLIPDYSYIDYAEKHYWQQNTSTSRITKIWYNMQQVSMPTETPETYYISSYRCLIVSPVELTFPSATELRANDQYIFRLKDYNDRKIYVYFASDDTELKNKPCGYTISKPVDQTALNNYPYVMELRF